MERKFLAPPALAEKACVLSWGCKGDESFQGVVLEVLTFVVEGW